MGTGCCQATGSLTIQDSAFSPATVSTQLALWAIVRNGMFVVACSLRDDTSWSGMLSVRPRTR